MTDEGDEDTRYELHVPMADLTPWFAEAEDYVSGRAEERQEIMDLFLKSGGKKDWEPRAALRRQRQS